MLKLISLQIEQVLSMSRLGGAAAVAPLVADMSSEVGILINVDVLVYSLFLPFFSTFFGLN